jgi:hypothetical protein
LRKEHNMTQIMADEQQLEAAAKSVATKLQAFHKDLTHDEHLALEMAVRHLAERPDDTAEDVAGYRDNQLPWKPSIVECVVWQQQARSLVETLTFGFITDYTPDCSQMPPPGQPA